MTDESIKSETPTPELDETPVEDVNAVTEPEEVADEVASEETAETPLAETADEAPAEAVVSTDPVDELEDDDDDEGEDMDVEPLELIEETEDEEDISMDWYILKVQVNREKSICEALQRRVKVEGLEKFFSDILVPTEDVREFTKTGKQRVVKRKLYPGYIVVRMAINDETWFAVRETPGIGDFTGSAGKPTPMLQHEIDRILKLARPEIAEETADIKTNIRFKQGQRVRVKEGHFQNFEGEVDAIDEAHGRVTVMINIFGRPTPVELEHWQVEDV